MPLSESKHGWIFLNISDEYGWQKLSVCFVIGILFHAVELLWYFHKDNME